MIYKYNPGFLSDDDSIRNFVVRHKDFRIVTEILNENSHASSNRHVLVVGPRGSGKSTLARRLVAELRTDASLAKAWHPVLLGEESYTITSAGEFWLECAFQLSEQCDSPSMRAKLEARYREIQSEKEDIKLRELAIGMLTSFSEETNRRILLVVENFNMIMEEQLEDSEGWMIRHALHNVQEIMLFATATRKFNLTSDKALFEQFKVHELRPLTLSEIGTLWDSLTQEKILQRKTRPIQILTGGTPRLIAILADFAVNHSFKDLMERLSSLIDQYTDYFKSQLDSLPKAERKVFVSVLERWDPATTREIAEEARIPVSLTSAQLSRLRTRGAVQRRMIDGSQYWEASERLFNLYYLMRRRGGPSSRVDALVRFMTVYYEGDQLYERATDLAKECSTLEPNKRQDHLAALTQIARDFDDTKKAHLVSLAPPDFAKQFAAAIARPANRRGRRHARVNEAAKGILGLIEQGQVRRAIELLETERFSKEVEAILWAMAGLTIGFKHEDFEEGHELLNKALGLDKKSGFVWYLHGFLLRTERRYGDAVESFKRAVDLGQNDAAVWTQLGDSYEELSDLERAEQSYRQAISIDPSAADAWSSLGLILASRGEQPKEAEAALRKAVDLAPQNANHLGRLGTFLLVEHSAAPQAEKIARDILDRDPTDARAWSLLIRAMSRSEANSKDIDNAFAEAMKSSAGKGRARISSAYADHLNRIRQHQHAEKILEEGTRASPDSGFAWLQLARQLAGYSENQAKAITAFSRALNLSPNDPTAWTNFGAFLSVRTRRHAEAEEALKKAIAYGPMKCTTWNALGEHLLRSAKLDEASDCFQKAITFNPKCMCALNNYSDVLIQQGDGLRAVTELIETFIQRAPGSPYPHIVIAKHAASLGRNREAAVEHLLAAVDKGFPARLLTEEFVEVLNLADAKAARNDIEKYLALSKEIDKTRNELAWGLYEKRVTGELLQYAISLSKSAVESAPDDWGHRHTLAALLAEAGKLEAALNEVRWLVDHLADQPSHIAEQALRELIELCIEIARNDKHRLLTVLEASSSRSTFEPLLVALKLGDGEEPNVAREILEVARDIRERFSNSVANRHEERVSGGTPV